MNTIERRDFVRARGWSKGSGHVVVGRGEASRGEGPRPINRAGYREESGGGGASSMRGGRGGDGRNELGHYAQKDVETCAFP